MIVMKFGGTSVAAAEAIRRVADIVRETAATSPAVVVVSALGGVTDELVHLIGEALTAAPNLETRIAALEQRHLELVDELFPEADRPLHRDSVRLRFGELRELLGGVRILGECSSSVRARILGFGESLSSLAISRFLASGGLANVLLDPVQLIRATGDPLDADVDLEETFRRIEAAVDPKGLSVAPGFVAGDDSADPIRPVTLGRGGSDYTAALFAAALGAERLEIWTDVSGILTAEPGLVRSAYPIRELGYEEVMELSHFGAKVIHPPSVAPVFRAGIPILVKNTFEPEAPGTRIANVTGEGSGAVRGISCIPGIALLTIVGAGMVGVPGTAERVFGALSRAGISVLFISQSSSEHTICLAVREEDAAGAKAAIETAFEPEIALGRVDPVQVEDDLAIAAVVGEGMRARVGLAGKTFSLLGENGVNIRAIAQGSTERNISMVIPARDRAKALNVLHEGFFLSGAKTVHLFCAGTGQVASSLFTQLAEQADFLEKTHGLRVRIAGLLNSRQMLIEPEGIDPASAGDRLTGDGEPADLPQFVAAIRDLNARNAIFVDNTASADVAAVYGGLLEANVSVVASNKIAAASPWPEFDGLQQAARRRGARYLFETNVAAGLPVLRTIEDLIRSGDRVHRIQAVVSGTLNYIYNTISADIPFSKAVAMARDAGLTEPDPAIDLSGLDVIRKITILGRLCGTPLEVEGVENRAIIGADAVGAFDWDGLAQELAKHDDAVEATRAEAEAQGKRLRFVATFEDGAARVGPESVDSAHPAYGLAGMDNIVLVWSDRYPQQPLVVQGAGAGPAVTAAGVFADILRIAHV